MWPRGDGAEDMKSTFCPKYTPLSKHEYAHHKLKISFYIKKFDFLLSAAASDVITLKT